MMNNGIGLVPFFLQGELWQYLQVRPDASEFYLVIMHDRRYVTALGITEKTPPDEQSHNYAKFCRYVHKIDDEVSEIQFHCFDAEVNSDEKGRLYRKVEQ